MGRKDENQILSKAIKSPNSSSWVENSRNGVSLFSKIQSILAHPFCFSLYHKIIVMHPAFLYLQKGELPFPVLTSVENIDLLVSNKYNVFEEVMLV